MTANPTNPAKPRSFLKRIPRMLGIALLVAVLVAVNAWAALAIYFANTVGSSPRYILAIIYVLAVGGAALFARPRRYGLLAAAAGFIIVLASYFSIKPTNDG